MSRGLKLVLCLLEYLLTPATILRRAVLENAKAFSVHETGFKHKIYRWLCFAEMRDLVSGTDQERVQDRAFLSVIGNRDV